MKKFIALIFMVAALAVCADVAGATVYAKNVVAQNGTEQSDNATVIWKMGDLTSWYHAKFDGVYVFIDNDDGNATSVVINFYATDNSTGDNDWYKFMPVDEDTKTPVAYGVTMPGSDAKWYDRIPIPEFTERVKAVVTFSGSCSDIIKLKMRVSTD